MSSGLYSGAFSRFLSDTRSHSQSLRGAAPLPRLRLPPTAPQHEKQTSALSSERLQRHDGDDRDAVESMLMLGPRQASLVRPIGKASAEFTKLPTPKRTRLDDLVNTTPTKSWIGPLRPSHQGDVDQTTNTSPSFSSVVTPSPTLSNNDDLASTPVTPRTPFEFPVAVSTRTSFSCHVCGKDFDRKSNLNKHIRHVHHKERPYECNLCGKRFGQKSSIDKHHLVVHLKMKTHKCNLCESSFGQVGDLNVHIRTVHEKKRPFGCATCGATFGLKSHLNKHIRVVHEKLRPYRCSHCSASFGENSDLKKHVRAVHEADSTK